MRERGRGRRGIREGIEGLDEELVKGYACVVACMYGWEQATADSSLSCDKQQDRKEP